MRNTIKVLVGVSVLSLFLTFAQQEAHAKQNAVDPQAMTAAHNALRSQLGIPSLTWSNTLAHAAQNWADQLARSSCRLRQSRAGYGENLYRASPKKYSNGIKKIQEISDQSVVNTWVNEGKNYNYTRNSCPEGCGNYTQIIWKDTTEVGCGMALCSDKAQIWVCNYSPAGNVIGRKPY
ncbi:MAG: SCP-like extracellular [Candidatus Electrothrix sp. ATG2]|nr:SCP-like extracellular [Candidatus Electrothrix sp. ATG2]